MKKYCELAINKDNYNKEYFLHSGGSKNKDNYNKEYFLHSGGSKWFRKGKIAPIYYKALNFLISNLDKGKIKHGVLLDAGCSRGDLVKLLLKKFPGFLVIGIDYSIDAILIAQMSTNSNSNVKFFNCDIKKIPIKKNSVDYVFCLDVVEHLYPWELNKAIKEIYRILNPNGKLVIHTFPTKYINNFWHKILGFLRKHSIGQDLHVNTQTYFSIKKLLEDNYFDAKITIETRNDLISSNITCSNKRIYSFLKILDKLYIFIWLFFSYTLLKYIFGSDLWVFATKRKIKR